MRKRRKRRGNRDTKKERTREAAGRRKYQEAHLRSLKLLYDQLEKQRSEVTFR